MRNKPDVFWEPHDAGSHGVILHSIHLSQMWTNHQRSILLFSIPILYHRPFPIWNLTSTPLLFRTVVVSARFEVKSSTYVLVRVVEVHNKLVNSPESFTANYPHYFTYPLRSSLKHPTGCSIYTPKAIPTRSIQYPPASMVSPWSVLGQSHLQSLYRTTQVLLRGQHHHLQLSTPLSPLHQGSRGQMPSLIPIPRAWWEV
ncbi:hypothetical protein BC938DRAFT_472099 [Jimgerdemannia flammicorona]|uniref:Uncharacterized protein n=1 Tax=Jimgerdemannia flammicorona TaxID=994334 RepID=A0A433Q6S7_9FUNG|nr:hypothetical protein BC938DRAFT_472099 [Jimgerdemannia flammicorona]